MLVIENLKFSCSGNIIMEDFSICIYPGAIIYLKGDNGSGKSTFLRIIAGIKDADSGSIKIFNKNLLQENFSNTLYFGHKLALKENLTVYEQIKLWAEIYNSPLSIPAIIKYWDIENILDYKIQSLSEGNKKKIALSKLFFSNFDIWLLDEVETNLDKKNKELLNAAITVKAASGGIIFISTHSETFIEKAQIIDISNFS